jgi:chitodextrinase
MLIRPLLSSVVTLALWALASVASASITYVQGQAGSPGSGSSVSVTYTSAQAAGDLNVVFVGWNQATSAVQSITDTRGNTYVAAVGPTVNPSGATQVMYYAQNIAASAAGTNSVTVTFASSVSYPDVRILEFSGISTTHPLDVSASAIGTGTTLNSGALTTTASNDLLVASGYVQHSYTGGAGSGYTQILVSAWNLVEDAIVTATGSYSATSTSTAGYWVMQQVAFRAANTSSDTTAPTAPSGLVATATASSQISVSWTASTDTVGVTGYLIERCAGACCSNFVQIGSSNSNSFHDTGLTASSLYTYRVRASDAVGNLSGYSNSAGETTLGAGPGFVQGNFSSPGAGSSLSVPFQSAQTAGDLNVVLVGWNQATSGVQSITDTKGNTYTVASGPTVNASGATQVVYYAKNIVAAAAGTNAVMVTLNSSVSYPDVRVLEFSGVDTTSPLDAAVAATGNGTTLNSGNLTTSAPNELLVAGGYVQHSYTGGAGAGFTQVLVSSWNLVEDAVATTAGSYSATSTASSGYWVMQLLAFKGFGSSGTPSAPAGLVPNTASNSEIDLQWNGSTAVAGISEYLIERCEGPGCSNFVQIGVSATLTYTDTGLNAAASYTYRVRARDTAGNYSSYSNSATATTQSDGSGGGGDTTPPTPPSLLAATAASSVAIQLTWAASSDNVGVTGYLIEQCQGTTCSAFSQTASSSSSPYTVIGLAPLTAYTFRIRATDAAGNLSVYSNTVSATTGSGGSVCD